MAGTCGIDASNPANPVKGMEVGKEPANKSIKVINETVFWQPGLDAGAGAGTGQPASAEGDTHGPVRSRVSGRPGW